MGMAKGGHNRALGKGKSKKHRRTPQRAAAGTFHGTRQVRYMYTCEPCNKRSYTSRKDAKKVNVPEDGGMRPYKCPHDPNVWHVGHMPRVVKQGEMTANEVYGRD